MTTTTFSIGETVEVFDLTKRGGVWILGTVAMPDDGDEYVTVDPWSGSRLAFLREHVRRNTARRCLECRGTAAHVIGCSRMDVAL